MTSRRMILLGLGAGGLSLAACAGPHGPGGPGGDPGRRQGASGLMAISPNSFARGVTLKREGQFTAALPYFAQVAGLGAGYEVAQYHLGDCLIRLGDAEGDSRETNQKHREGAFWVTLAAQSGDVNAQGLFAELLFAGKGVPIDRTEAAKFLTLADDNARSDFLHDERREGLEAVRAELVPEEMEEGRLRATSFYQLFQTHRSLPEIERPQGGSRPNGGGGRGGGGRGGGGRGGMPGGYWSE